MLACQGNFSVSAIIPTYNRARFLLEASRSVLNQTHLPQELIIVDDGSTDETQSHIIPEVQQLVRRLNHHQSLRFQVIQQSNKGVAAARNRALQTSQGAWIAFLDSDDHWLPIKLERQIRFLRDHPETLIVHSDEIWIRNGKRVNPKKRHQKGGGDQFESSLKLCLISPSCVLIHRSVFDSIGIFDEDLPVCEDYDLWLRMTAKYKIGYIQEPLIKKFGGHSDQLSRSKVLMDYYRLKSLNKILTTRDLSSCQETLVVKEIATKSQILIKGCLKHGNLEILSEVNKIQNLAREIVC